MRRLWLAAALVTAASCQVVAGLTDLDPSGLGGGGSGGEATGGAGGATGGSGGEGGLGGGGGEGGVGGVGGTGGGGGSTCHDAMPGNCMMCPMPAGACTSSTECKVVCDNNNCLDPALNVSCGMPSAVTHDCVVDCNDTQCATVPEIICPESEDSTCTVNCNSPGSCLNTTIRCGDGPCKLTCVAGACDGTTTMRCGVGECEVDCVQGSAPTLAMDNLSCEVDVSMCPGI